MQTFTLLICLAIAFGVNRLDASGAEIMAAVAPLYPPVAASSRISGTVIVRSTVDASGVVTRVAVLEGHQLLKRAAEEAAKQWKFNSSPEADRSYNMKFTFVLLPEDAPEPSRIIFLPPNQVEVDLRPARPTVNYGGAKGRESSEPANTAPVH